jgi:hypothetical protein
VFGTRHDKGFFGFRHPLTFEGESVSTATSLSPPQKGVLSCQAALFVIRQGIPMAETMIMAEYKRKTTEPSAKI